MKTCSILIHIENNIVPLLNDQANNSAYIALQSITNSITENKLIKLLKYRAMSQLCVSKEIQPSKPIKVSNTYKINVIK